MKISTVLALSIAIHLTAAAARAQTWDGGGTNDSLLTAANWNPDAVPGTTADVTFAGVVRLTPSVGANFQVNSLTFNNTAGAFVFGGTSTLNISGGGLVNNDATGQIFNNPVSFSLVPASFISASSGALTLNGTVTLPTLTLTLSGANPITFGTTVAGTGAVTKNGTGAFTLAGMSSGPGAVIGADFNFNSGAATIGVNGTPQTFTNASTIAVNNTATLAFNESTVLDGGQLTRASGAGLTIAAGKTLTVQSGADATITGSFVNAATSTIAVTGAGSTLTTPDGHLVFNAGTLNVLAGGAASCQRNLDFSVAGGTSGATVDGTGSSLVGGATTIGGTGASGGTGMLSLANGGTGTLGAQLLIADSTSAAATGTLNIQSGATATVNGNINVSSLNGGGAGTISITGGGSALTQSGAGTLTVGAATGAVDGVNLLSGATFTSGTGLTTVNATGRLNVTAGRLNANGDILLNGTGAQFNLGASGVFTHTAGKTLTIQGGADAVFPGGSAFHNTSGANVTVSGADSTFQAGALGVGSGSTLAIQSGGSVGATSLSVGAAGNGNLTVDGAGSSASGTGATGSSVWGGGAAASVTFSNGASGNFVTLAIADSPLSTSVVQVLTGADVTTTGNMRLANVNGAATGTLTVDGAGSTWTQTGSATITVGAAFGSAATLNVRNGGVFTTGTGLMSVNATGRVEITGGVLKAEGDLTLSGPGAQLNRDATGVFSLDPDKLLTIRNTADASFAGSYFTRGGNVTVSGAGSTLQTTAGGGMDIDDGSTLAIYSGAGVTLAGRLDIGDGSNGTMIVDGLGSSVTAGNGNGIWGSGASAEVTFSDGASGNFDGLTMGFGSGTAMVEVFNGADVTNSGNLALGLDATPATGSLTVEGSGSTWTQTGSSFIDIGGASGSIGTLNVQNEATFITGTGGFRVRPTGRVNLDGGTLEVNGALTSTGAFNFTAGTLNLLGPNDLTIGTGGLLGTNLVLLSDRTLTVAGTTTIDAARTLTLDGGTLRTGALDNDGALDFRRGTLGVTGAGGFDIGSGALGANVTLGSGAALQVTSTASISSGASLTLDGGSLTGSGTLANAGTLRVNSGLVTALAVANNNGGRVFLSDTFALSGSSWNNDAGSRLTLENGGLLIGGLFGGLNNSGLVTGDGTIAVKLANSITGEIRAEAGRTLYFTATLHEQNNGKLSLSGGTLDFTAPLTNSSAGFISGRGTLFTGGLTNNGVMAFSAGNADISGDVTNAAAARILSSGGAVTTFFDDVVHNGAEIRTSSGSASVFLGSVSGSGPFTGTGTVYFEGDLRPGSSPGSVTMTPQIVFSRSNTLVVEIGGRSAGTEHDKLIFTSAFSPQVSWGGELAIQFINGFTPASGDVFDIFDFDAARDAGAFDTLSLPSLPAGLRWDSAQLYTGGSIRVVPQGVTFSEWAATVPGDPATTPGGDHDRDGFDNAAEFALGLFPPQAGTVLPNGGLHTYPDGERLRLLFTRPLDRTGLTVRVQGSGDLTTWTDLATSVDSAPFTGPGFVSENRSHPLHEPGLVEVRDTVASASGARRYLRIHLVLAP